MRKNYPVLSEELNDKFQKLYYDLTYILGYDDENGVPTYSGQFDYAEQDLRDAIYLVLPQLNASQDQLILNKGTSNEVELYSLWGKYIVINELRSM